MGMFLIIEVGDCYWRKSDRWFTGSSLL